MKWLTRRIFAAVCAATPKMTRTEKEALEAGDVWWEAEFFTGKPNWHRLLSLPKPTLTQEEQSFIDIQVEALCAMLDDWKITHEQFDLSKQAWAYLKKEGFFGLIVPKAFGGREFSALANSTIVTKIASKSLTAAVTAMVPNSLGPAELLMHYGTDEQKNYYLPRLAVGEEVPCFALTGALAGSDASAMPDNGVVCKGQWAGQEIIGIRLNWNKRYITLAPVATLLGLAFKLYDPEHLLGQEKDIGITLALIPTSHPGVEIGRRHLALSTPFMNGPTRGQDVFIPLDWIIGGVERAGQGWRMLMDCLSAGRAISLPALSAASAKVSYRMTGAYARIRKQFKTPIGYFEGVQEALTEISGLTYLIEAARVLTCTALDQKIKPSVVSAIAKYHMTEMGRRVVSAAMDVHGGRAIMLGKRNYLARAYESMPIAITVEGSNILTRNLIIFGQGAVRCHPFLRKEMQACEMKNSEEGLHAFHIVFWQHVRHLLKLIGRALALTATNGRWSHSPTPGKIAPYYHKLNRLSAAFALISEIALAVMGGDLKRKERLSARLGDALSHLYLASAVLKYFHDHDSSADDWPHAEWSLQTCLWNIQNALVEFLQNFPNRIMGRILKFLLFSMGLPFKKPKDALSQQLAMVMLVPSEFRGRLTKECFVGKAQDPMGRVEQAFLKVTQVAPIEKRLSESLRDGRLKKAHTFESQIELAKQAGLLTQQEAKALLEAEAAVLDAIEVDEFSPEYLTREQEITIQEIFEING